MQKPSSEESGKPEEACGRQAAVAMSEGMHSGSGRKAGEVQRARPGERREHI